MTWNPSCKGPNPEQSKKCKEQAEAYYLMEKFYMMDVKYQMAFVAMFNALENESGNSPKIR